MNKRGWNSPKGLVLLIIISLTVLTSYMDIFGESITGNVIRTSESMVELNVKESVYFNGKTLSLDQVRDNTATLEVDGIKKILFLDEMDVINGLTIRVIEVRDEKNQYLDKARILVRDSNVKMVDPEHSTGRFKVNYDESILLDEISIRLSPTEDANEVRIFVNDINKKLEIGETWDTHGLIITLVDVKNYIGKEFDEAELIIRKGPQKLTSILDKKYDLPSNYPVDIDGKLLTLIKTNSVGTAQFSVDGAISFVKIHQCEIRNGVQICVSEVQDKEGNEFDRAIVNVKKEVKEYIFN